MAARGHAANPLEFQWHDPPSSREEKGIPLPGSRTYFSLVVYDNKLWMFGGFGDSKERFNEVHCYDPATHTWSKVATQNPPKPMYLHSASIFGSKMYVYGGSDGKDSDRFYSLDLNTLSWHILGTNGVNPGPRYGHASTVCDGKLYVAGGCRKSSSYLRDAFEFDIGQKLWRSLPDVPVDLAYHTLFTYESKVYCIGGFNGLKYSEHLYCLNNRLNMWDIVHTRGKSPTDMPSARCGAAIAITGNSLWMFGGYTADGHTSTLYELDLRDRIWRLRTPGGPAPQSRAYLQAAIVDRNMFIYGGYDGQRCVVDFKKIAVLPNVAHAMQHFPVSSQVDYILHFFSSSADSLSRSELERLLTHMGDMVLKPQEQESYPFDISVVKDIVPMGFERHVVLDCMMKLHQQGKNPTRIDTLLDALATHTMAPAETSDYAIPPAHRQTSERTELKQKLQDALAENEDLRTCKVCFERLIDCVSQHCGHLAMCQQCARDLQAKRLPCPICRKPVNNILEVFWA